eukprot:766738-Hanusia_phi.AAC.5
MGRQGGRKRYRCLPRHLRGQSPSSEPLDVSSPGPHRSPDGGWNFSSSPQSLSLRLLLLLLLLLLRQTDRLPHQLGCQQEALDRLPCLVDGEGDEPVAVPGRGHVELLLHPLQQRPQRPSKLAAEGEAQDADAEDLGIHPLLLLRSLRGRAEGVAQGGGGEGRDLVPDEQVEQEVDRYAHPRPPCALRLLLPLTVHPELLQQGSDPLPPPVPGSAPHQRRRLLQAEPADLVRVQGLEEAKDAGGQRSASHQLVLCCIPQVVLVHVEEGGEERDPQPRCPHSHQPPHPSQDQPAPALRRLLLLVLPQHVAVEEGEHGVLRAVACLLCEPS